MKKKILIFLLVFVALFSFNYNVNAKSLYEAGDKLDITDKYNGTVFFAGETIKSDAEINGISFMAANTITTKGITEYGAYAGNVVTINGKVNNDLFSAGSNINLDGAEISRDSYMAASSIDITDTTFGRNIYMTASSITLDNVTINGNVNISANIINIGDNVVIKGTLNYNEDAKLEKSKTVTINKTKTYEIDTSSTSIYAKEKDALLSVISSFILLTLIYLLFPKVFKKIDNNIKDNKISDYLNKMGVGFISLIMVPIVCMLLLFTYICIPVSLILMGVYMICVYLSTLITSYVLGNKLYTTVFKKEYSFYASVLIGLLIIKEVSLVPVLGFIIGFISLIYGLGLITKLFTDKKN